MKLDQSISFAGTILPDTSADKFRFFYESNAGTLGWINSDTGVINENSSNLSPGTYYVYARVFEIDKNHYYAPGNSLWREMIVKVEPYYVQSISFADVELEPGANVTLVPTFTSDVSGKQPTTTKLTWESSNNQIATVDENGLVTALGVGDVTITATATDGSGVKGTCKVTITVPWKEFEVGQYVVRRSNGEIDFFSSATDAKNNGTVVGVVIYKGNPRVSDAKLPSTCTHGIAVGIKELKGQKALSAEPTEGIYSMKKYVDTYPEKGYVSPVGISYSGGYYINDIGKKPYGYNNTLLYREWVKNSLPSYGITAPLLDALDAFSVTLPNEVSNWYLPSIFELNLIAQQGLSSVFTAVDGDGIANTWNYWSLSEVEGNARTRYGLITLSSKQLYCIFSSLGLFLFFILIINL